AFAAAVTIVRSTNSAETDIGETASLRSYGDLAIVSYAEDNFRNFAIGATKANTTVQLAGGVAVTGYTNVATTKFEGAASAAAADRLSVDAQARVPLQITLDDALAGLINTSINAPAFDASTPASTIEGLYSYANFVPDLMLDRLGDLTLLLPKKILPGLITTSYASGSVSVEDKDLPAGAPTESAFGLAGNVNITRTENRATTTVGRGARLNQGQAADFARPEQSVAVTALSLVESIHAAAQSPLFIDGIVGASGVEGGIATGGSYLQYRLVTSAVATVDDEARINARRDIEVGARTKTAAVQLIQSGSKAAAASSTRPAVGISGAAVYSEIDNTTRAHVEDTAVLEAGRDVAVTADYDHIGVTFAITRADARAGANAGASVAVGATVAIQQVDNEVEATVGNTPGSPAGGGSGKILAGRNVRVLAETDALLFSVTAAGTTAGQRYDVPPADGDPLDGFALPELFKESDQKTFKDKVKDTIRKVPKLGEKLVGKDEPEVVSGGGGFGVSGNVSVQKL
ncbi:MAG: hypothetical protein K2X91_09740, partial [Thermoleophilia bacterium]|nr:hypothetical protein [Thermoleophilia bacterium]